MRKVEIMFGDDIYVVTELPSRANAAWRGRLQDFLNDVRDIVAVDPSTRLSLDFVSDLLGKIQERVVGSIGIISDLLFDYSPELSENREHIESTCYDSEIVDAFLQVLKLAFPFFGSLPEILGEDRKKIG